MDFGAKIIIFFSVFHFAFKTIAVLRMVVDVCTSARARETEMIYVEIDFRTCCVSANKSIINCWTRARSIALYS